MRRIVWALALCGSLVTTAQGQDALTPVIAVQLGGEVLVPAWAMLRAKAIASHMFASAGIRVDWQTKISQLCDSPLTRSIWIEISDQTPANLYRGAMAYTRPYSEAQGRVTVFYDRIRPAMKTQREMVPILLAHVMVHEMTHLLERYSGHSETGVMKAEWTSQDYAHMKREPLPFTEGDIRMSRAGLLLHTSSSCAATAATKDSDDLRRNNNGQ